MTAPGLAAAANVEIPDEHLLGWLATYTLPDEERSGAKVMRVWAQRGLDVDDLPPMRQPFHVFQSACASVNENRPANGGQKVQIRADEIENNGACRYQITVKVWDQANKLIEHEKAMRVSFNKDTHAIDVDRLGYNDPRLAEIEDRIRNHYDANTATVPGQKIRNAVRDTVIDIGGQNVRRKAGGLYFVPKHAIARNGSITGNVPTRVTLDALANVLRDLYGDRADFYVIPLANQEGMRDMVRKHFTINANEKARELCEKAVQRVRQGKGRGVRAELVTNLINERRRLGGAANQFVELVNVEQDDLKANMRDLDKAIAELQELADA
jgi:hypothetical protein